MRQLLELTVEEELPSNRSLAFRCGLRQVPSRSFIAHCLLVEHIAVKFPYARHINLAQVREFDEQLSARQHVAKEIHVDLVNWRRVVLALYREHMHNVFLALQLGFNIRTGNLELTIGVLLETSLVCRLARRRLCYSLLCPLCSLLGRREVRKLLCKSILELTR